MVCSCDSIFCKVCDNIQQIFPVVCNSPFNLYLQKHFIDSRGCNDGYNKLGMYFMTKINYIVILGV